MSETRYEEAASLTKEQARVLVETLNTLTVGMQELCSRLTYEAGADAGRIQNAMATANRELFEAFPEFKAPA